MVESTVNSNANPPASHASLWPAYRALMGTGLACAVLIVVVFYATKPIIEAKRVAQLEAAIFKVLPGTSHKRDFFLSAEGEFFHPSAVPPAVQSTARKLYVGFDNQGVMTGIAIEAQGMGYQDTIRLLYGYKPGGQFISGIQVLDSKETPGLGDKIEKDPAFVANFDRLDVSLAEGKRTLLHAIVAVKNGLKTEPWQIDGITGATISSDAIASILQKSASAIVPDLFAQQAWMQALYDGADQALSSDQGSSLDKGGSP